MLIPVIVIVTTPAQLIQVTITFLSKFCYISLLVQGKITYVVRPLVLPGCESKVGRCEAIGTRDPLSLGGYGVELALKNMEYKAMDDSVVKKGLFCLLCEVWWFILGLTFLLFEQR